MYSFDPKLIISSCYIFIITENIFQSISYSKYFIVLDIPIPYSIIGCLGCIIESFIGAQQFCFLGFGFRNIPNINNSSHYQIILINRAISNIYNNFGIIMNRRNLHYILSNSPIQYISIQLFQYRNSLRLCTIQNRPAPLKWYPQ